jgi:hypothetical protein
MVTPLYMFMAWSLIIKPKDNFTFHNAENSALTCTTFIVGRWVGGGVKVHIIMSQIGLSI